MEKEYGTIERKDSFVKFKKGAFLVWGYGEEEIDGEKHGFDYRHTFDIVPTKHEVLEMITNLVNNITDEKILSGFVWNDTHIWLSTENQFNFKAAYDVAVQTSGMSLPVKFKLGEQDGVPQYYVFDTMEKFTDFYTKAMAFIMQTLNEGWEEKDNARQWVESLDL